MDLMWQKRDCMIQTLSWSPNWFGPVDRASACELKGPWFDFSQGHVHWLWAHPQWGVCRRQLVGVSLIIDVSSSLSLSLSLCKKINKIYIFLKKRRVLLFYIKVSKYCLDRLYLGLE